MFGIGEYLWRLVPGNPILQRVVAAGSRRKRDLIIRCGYLGLLVALACFKLITGTSFNTIGLGELAKDSDTLFLEMSYLQLGLVALLAPIFTAGAITQEKDAQTYDVLLATPLTNGQIVLGSLLSRVFFIVALLVSGIPIFSITQVFGGVAIRSIVISFAIAAATALVTGAMAMAIATFKVGTRRTIFSFYLFIVVYLVGIYLLDRVDFFHPMLGYQTSAGKVLTDSAGQPIPVLAKTSWLTGIHPFLALRVIFDPDYAPPDLGALPEHLRFWPVGQYLANPDSYYVGLMLVISLVLITPSILLLRRLAQASGTLRGWILQTLRLSKGDRRRKPRYVWHNPIAWREARTKASAARATVLRYGFMASGLAGALVLLALFATHQPVAAYVQPGSYDPANSSLTVYGDKVATYVVSPGFAPTWSGQPASVELLNSNVQFSNPTFEQRWVIDAAGDKHEQRILNAATLSPIPRRLEAPEVRRWLLGLIIVEFAVILLIVTNAAASTVTREKEDGTLDLLLTTPITSRYYIWGKLRGLVSFVLPLAAVPVLSVLAIVIYDLWRLVADKTAFAWVVYPESLLVLPGTLIIVAAFAAILGMNMSLRCRTTVWAVMSSIGIVAGACFLLGGCGFSVLNNASFGLPGLVISSFSPFTLITVLIDPFTTAKSVFVDDADDIGSARLLIFFFGWIAAAGYTAVVWTMYKSMVKNFDMTIRRQQR